jgi:hypothetical protein
MRHVWRLAFVIVLGVSAAGAARAGAQGTGFEGTLTFQMQGEKGSTMTMVSTTKGNKLRMEVSDPANPTHAGEVVMDGDAHTEMMIMPQQKQYMVIPQSMMDAMKDRADSGVKFTFNKTGRTETVAGVSCQVVHVSGTKNGKPQEGDMCVAKGVGFDPAAWSSMGGRSGAGGEMAQVRAAVGPGNGIMKIVTTSEGQPLFSMEVTKVDRSRVSADAFTPPAGYTQMQMPAGAGGAPR